MHKLKWLQWKHQRALRVFEIARDSLAKIASQLQDEMNASNARIKAREDAILAERIHITGLMNHQWKVREQHKKISAIVGDAK